MISKKWEAVGFPFFSGQWLVDSGQKDAGKFYSNKSEKVLIKLFQKFAEFEAVPHFNARASARASALQNGEGCFDILE